MPSHPHGMPAPWPACAAVALLGAAALLFVDPGLGARRRRARRDGRRRMHRRRGARDLRPARPRPGRAARAGRVSRSCSWAAPPRRLRDRAVRHRYARSGRTLPTSRCSRSWCPFAMAGRDEFVAHRRAARSTRGRSPTSSLLTLVARAIAYSCSAARGRDRRGRALRGDVRDPRPHRSSPIFGTLALWVPTRAHLLVFLCFVLPRGGDRRDSAPRGRPPRATARRPGAALQSS